MYLIQLRIPNKNECIRMVKILNGLHFHGVNIKMSVNKFYRFDEDCDQSVNSVSITSSSIKATVDTTKGVVMTKSVDQIKGVEDRRDKELKKLKVKMKKLTCMVSQLAYQLRMVRNDTNHLGEAVIDHFIPATSPDDVDVDVDEVDKQFTETFDFDS